MCILGRMRLLRRVLLPALAGNVFLVGLLAIGYGLDWYAMLWAPLP